MCQNLVPLVNIKIAGKWMVIPLKMVLIGIDPYPFCHILSLKMVIFHSYVKVPEGNLHHLPKFAAASDPVHLRATWWRWTSWTPTSRSRCRRSSADPTGRCHLTSRPRVDTDTFQDRVGPKLPRKGWKKGHCPSSILWCPAQKRNRWLD